MTTAIPAEGASRHLQSTPTAGAMMPEQREYQTRADLEPTEPEVTPDPQPSVDPENPVDPATDPVVEEVEAKAQQDAISKEQAIAHEASPEETVRIAELEQQREQMDTQFAAQKQEIQASLADIAAKEESGDLSPHEASRAREALYDQRANLAEQSAMERSVLMAEIKDLERTQAENVRNWRQPIANDPEFVAWAQSEEGQAALNNPRNQAVYGGSPAGPWMEQRFQASQARIAELESQLAQREQTVAAAANAPVHDKVSGVKASPAGVSQTQTASRPDARKDPQGYQNYLAQTYFTGQA